MRKTERSYGMSGQIGESIAILRRALPAAGPPAPAPAPAPPAGASVQPAAGIRSHPRALDSRPAAAPAPRCAARSRAIARGTAGRRLGRSPSASPRPPQRTYPSRIGRRPALFLLDHISPIFARFFSVFSLFSPSRRQDSRKWHQKTGGRLRNGPKRPVKEWSPTHSWWIGIRHLSGAPRAARDQRARREDFRTQSSSPTP